MTQTIQIKRRNTGSAGAPASLASGELAWNNVDQTIYFGAGDNGSGVATSIVKIAGPGAYILSSLLGAVSGVATLDTSGKLSTAQIPAALIGAIVYQGTWNATTNSPALNSGSGTKGFYYKIATAGSTVIDGTSNWQVGDMIVFNGTAWDKIDGPDEAVTSVAGRIGAVTLTSSDLTDSTSVGRSLLAATSLAVQRATLKIDQRTPVADGSYTMSSSDYNVQYTSISAARTVTLVAASTFNPGARIRVGDASGSASATNTITVAVNGSDTINGGATASITSAYGQVELLSDGASKWTICSQTSAAPANVDGGTY